MNPYPFRIQIQLVHTLFLKKLNYLGIEEIPDSYYQYRGAPKDVFNASVVFNVPSGPIVGIVSPGRIHCCKKVQSCIQSLTEHPAVHWDLQPTMTLRTRLLATQQLQVYDSVGYGSTFRAEVPMTVGVAACGLADGYPRHAPTGTPVLVAGVYARGGAREHGHADHRSHAAAGRRGGRGRGQRGHAVGPGRERGAAGPIDEVAQAAGTIGYELMCAPAPRVPVQVS